jgi:hypothetical protein
MATYVGHIADAAKEAITANRPTVVVLAALDESFFMASPDGLYHIHGNLVVAGNEAQKSCLT